MRSSPGGSQFYLKSERTKLSRHRIEELSRRATEKAVQRSAITKELILNELWDNAQKVAEVKGGQRPQPRPGANR
jgi:hypothetical protein